MSTLMVETLETTITQTITFTPYRKFNLGGIKIKLFMYNSPSGTFTLSLKSGANTLWSDTFDSAELKSDMSTSDDYIYMWKGFQFSNPVIVKNGSYDLELSSSGYTYSTGSFIGWIKDYESIYNETTTTPANDFENPYTFRLYEYRKSESVI